MTQYSITGMSCAACQARVEKAVSAVDGVESCAVSLLTNSMGVEGSANASDIITAVENAGYGASLKDKGNGDAASAVTYEDELKDTNTPKIRNRLIASLILLIPLMYVSMGHMMLGLPLPAFMDGNHIAMGLYELLLSGLIMVINQRFFISGFKSVMHRSPNMDTLVAMGAAASFGYSVYALFAMTVAEKAGDAGEVMRLMDEFYFESAAMILTLITVGKLLESISKGRTTDALKGLMKLAPKTAILKTEDGEKEVPVDRIQIGDIFVLRPGSRVPVDGVVIEGQSAVDESALTGESIPVDKGVGDMVSSATINKNGHMVCRATRIGNDTTLSKIIQMVSDAAATKAPIARIADRVSGVFVPAVICIAVVVFVVWRITGQTVAYSLERAIAVLVVSCPCALGLATPVAIMVGNGVAARNGILFKTSEALEIAGRVRVAALDKTGTITEGKPIVTDIIPSDGVSKGELIKTAYSLEIKSEHPLAGAITSYGDDNGIIAEDVSDFKIFAGNGLLGSVGGESVRGGSKDYISAFVHIDDVMESRYETLTGAGKTPLFFEKEGKLLGVIAVADVIKPDSARAISELKSLGIEVVMLTGDNERTAAAIGEQAGVDEVIANVRPDGKEEVIRKLQSKGRVAMVGDGINDAPALVSADAGIAIGAGTDVAIDSADIVLMNSGLSDVSYAIKLSKATLRNIYENLFWAFAYNVILIPMACGLYPKVEMSPMWGAAAMAISSFTVCMNALRLNLFKVKNQNVTGQNEKGENTKMQETTISVKGMMCQNCEKHVKKALEGIDGIIEATSDHTNGTVLIKHDAPLDENAMSAAVDDAGYEYVGIAKG